MIVVITYILHNIILYVAKSRTGKYTIINTIVVLIIKQVLNT